MWIGRNFLFFWGGGRGFFRIWSLSWWAEGGDFGAWVICCWGGKGDLGSCYVRVLRVLGLGGCDVFGLECHEEMCVVKYCTHLTFWGVMEYVKSRS